MVLLRDADRDEQYVYIWSRRVSSPRRRALRTGRPRRARVRIINLDM